ncbi:Transcriptional regulator, LysR family protein [Minicystis rosea]|nr:Transcriptional regulator, LysR family protein [Minicystis rosea]
MGQTSGVDVFGELGVFVRVVDARSFTRAGEALGLTASGVSRVVARLEARLGVPLIQRTTRSIGLTADGAAYYERCRAILRDLEDANSALARARGAPRGRLRVDAPSVIGRNVLAPALPRFLDAHPELSVDLRIRDHVIDPVAEGIDVVLRMAELRESELVHKKLGTLRLVVVASPRYLARRGRPSEPADLREHDTLGFLAGPTPIPWRFRTRGRDTTFVPTGRLQTNSLDARREAILAGFGLAQLFEPDVRGDLADGSLEIVLSDHELPARALHALYTRDKANLPKVRVFLDFVAQCMRGPRKKTGRS